MAAEKRWTGVDGVAIHLGEATDPVYRWIDEGGLPAHCVGWLFPYKLSEIDERVCQDNEREEIPSSVPSRPSSKTQTNRSTPKICSRKRGRNG